MKHVQGIYIFFNIIHEKKPSLNQASFVSMEPPTFNSETI